MALAIFNGVVQDAEGNAVSGATIEVRSEDTGMLVPIFADRDGVVGRENPYLQDGAAIEFHAVGGNYRITATKGAEQKVWRWVAMGTAQALDTEDLVSSLQAGIAPVPTLAALNAYAPPAPEPGVTAAPRGGVVWNDPNPALNGYYVYNFGTSAWVRSRPLFDTLASLAVASTAGNQVTAQASAGVDPGAVKAFYLDLGSWANTGPMTIRINGAAAIPVLDVNNAPMAAGLATGRLFLSNEGNALRLIVGGDIQAAAAAAQAAATAAAASAASIDPGLFIRFRGELPNGTDLNDASYRQRGFWTVRSDATALTILNRPDPSTRSGLLIVYGENNMWWQEYRQYRGGALGGFVWKRQWHSDNYSAWQLEFNDASRDIAQWALKPLGEIIYVTQNSGAAVPPINDPRCGVWIELRAGLLGSGAFNNGKLDTEVTSGSSPLITSTARVAVAGPMLGNTIRHLMTEGRITRPSINPGSTQDDATQDWEGSFSFARFSGGANIVRDRSGAVTSDGSAGGAEAAFPNSGTGAPYREKIDPKSAGVRTANETRMRNMGVRAFMKVA